MDSETLTAILTAAGILAGGGGLYGIQRARIALNGTADTPGANPMTTTGTHPAVHESVSPAFCQAQHSAVTDRLDRVDDQLEKGGKKMDDIRDTLTSLTVDMRALAPTMKAEAREAAREEAKAEVEGHERRRHNGGG